MLVRLTRIRADVMATDSSIESNNRNAFDSSCWWWKMKKVNVTRSDVNRAYHVDEKESFCLRTALMQRKRLSQLIRRFLLCRQ